MIIPINHVADWRYICQDVIRENTTRTDHYYRVGDKLMTIPKSGYKYETLFRVRYKIVHVWENGTVTLRMGTITMKINICNIKTYNTMIVEG